LPIFEEIKIEFIISFSAIIKSFIEFLRESFFFFKDYYLKICDCDKSYFAKYSVRDNKFLTF